MTTKSGNTKSNRDTTQDTKEGSSIQCIGPNNVNGRSSAKRNCYGSYYEGIRFLRNHYRIT